MSRTIHVLVVDDEMSIREVLADGLESFGLEVVQAENAAGAFDIVKRGGIDLVLSDMQMPGEHGLSLLRRIKDLDRKSTRLNSSHIQKSRMPSSA